MDLEQLEKLSAAPIRIKIPLPHAGRKKPEFFEITARRLTAAQTARVVAIRREALPPRKPGAKPGDEDQFDLNDPQYLERSDDARKRSRALTLYFGVPEFAAKVPGEDLAKFADWLESKFSDGLLNVIYEGITALDSTFEDEVDFFSGISPRS